MEAYHEFVKRVVAAFDGAELDYAFTGALAISFYGIPRTTSAVDVIVAVTRQMAVKGKLICALHNAGLFVDERKIDNVFTSGFSIVSLKDSRSPYSLDVILSTEKLDKQKGEVAGLKTYLQSPEGLIAAKLRMIKVTVPLERSAKDRRDIAAVLKFTKVDLEKVALLAKKDKTKDVLDSLDLNA